MSMEIVTGVFGSRSEAERALSQLKSLGIPEDRIGLLTPGMTDRQVERSVRTTDSEEPGMGKAMGGAVGAALGVASGASLGAAAASLLIPGVGPVLAIGLIAGALLGAGGAVAGAAVGESLEEGLGEGLPHEDLYLFEDALRRGHTVVIAFAEDGSQADRAREALVRSGAEDLDAVRENWWARLREDERKKYETDGRDFERDEPNYRRGFQAALHPKMRGKAFAEVEAELKADNDLDAAFRHGYERGLSYQRTVVEIHKV
jgi:hypothetical protein